METACLHGEYEDMGLVREGKLKFVLLAWCLVSGVGVRVAGCQAHSTHKNAMASTLVHIAYNVHRESVLDSVSRQQRKDIKVSVLCNAVEVKDAIRQLRSRDEYDVNVNSLASSNPPLFGRHNVPFSEMIRQTDFNLEDPTD